MDLLTTIAVISLCAILLGRLCTLIKLPPLIAMLVIGIVLGPFVLNLISPSLLHISSDLRSVALVIILMRAGLNLDIKHLKSNGLSAILLCFLPAVMEIIAYTLFSKLLLNISFLEGALMGCVMSAVSPAVIVPRMLKLKQLGYGMEKGIPQTIMAGASADDILVMVLFSAVLSMNMGSGNILNVLWQVPLSIVLGVLIGGVCAFVFVLIIKRFHIRDTIKVIVMLSICFLFVFVENILKDYFPVSSLLAVMTFGIVVLSKHPVCAKRLSGKFSKLWIFAEILLFVLVGCEVNINYALQNAGMVIALIMIALVFRMLGVLLCVLRSPFNFKEKLFCMLAYIPKATVQAGIGAVPLSMGLACGEIILTTAVLGILITAPLGAFLTDIAYKKLLTRTDTQKLEQNIDSNGADCKRVS